MSAPGCSRRTSRSRRRTRLRATAVPRRRPIANAMRGRSSPGSGANEIHNASLSKRRPRRSAMKSALLRHESIRRSAVAGPCVDEPSLQHGRRGWTSGDEIRGGGLGGECGVGTCVSRCSLLGAHPANSSRVAGRRPKRALRSTLRPLQPTGVAPTRHIAARPVCSAIARDLSESRASFSENAQQPRISVAAESAPFACKSQCQPPVMRLSWNCRRSVAAM